MTTNNTNNTNNNTPNLGITVHELFYACKCMIAAGHGNKHIQISQDDEGNGFHSLFFEFTTKPEDLQYYLNEGLLPGTIENIEEIVLLG